MILLRAPKEVQTEGPHLRPLQVRRIALSEADDYGLVPASVVDAAVTVSCSLVSPQLELLLLLLPSPL